MTEETNLQPAPPIGTAITSWREWTDFSEQYSEWLNCQATVEDYSFQDWEGNKLRTIHDLRSPSDILFVSDYELQEGFKVVPFLKQQPKRPAPKQCVIKNSLEGFLLKTQFRDWCCDHKRVLDSFYQLDSKGQKEKVDVDYNSGFPWVVIKTADRFKDKYETVSAFEPISLVEATEVISKIEEALQEKEKLETAIKDVETSVFNFLNGLE